MGKNVSIYIEHFMELVLTSFNSFGYPAAFLERQKFLAVLYNELRHKDRVHTGQKVVSVRYEAGHAVVRTIAGREYLGNLVVGADGVHSAVRSEMWRHAEEDGPGIMTEKKPSALKLEFACIYGISNEVPGVEAGVWSNLLDKQLTLHFIGIKDGKVFWFLIFKPERDWWHADGHLQSITTEETRAVCNRLRSKKLTPTLTFGDLWTRCEIFKMTPLEEGWFKTWHHHRLVIMGDAVRKVSQYIYRSAVA